MSGMTSEDENDLREKFLNRASTWNCVGYVKDLGHDQIFFFS